MRVILDRYIEIIPEVRGRKNQVLQSIVPSAMVEP